MHFSSSSRAFASFLAFQFVPLCRLSVPGHSQISLLDTCSLPSELLCVCFFFFSLAQFLPHLVRHHEHGTRMIAAEVSFFFHIATTHRRDSLLFHQAGTDCVKEHCQAHRTFSHQPFCLLPRLHLRVFMHICVCFFAVRSVHALCDSAASPSSHLLSMISILGHCVSFASVEPVDVCGTDICMLSLSPSHLSRTLPRALLLSHLFHIRPHTHHPMHSLYLHTTCHTHKRMQPT